MLFQSTLPVWGATEIIAAGCVTLEISIHAPRVGSDAEIPEELYTEEIFQSTLPVWGATLQRNVS